MTTVVHTGSQALVPTAVPPSSPVPNAHSLKLPNVDEIDDFINRVQETTDALSRLLLKESRWINSLLSDQRKLVDSCVERFRGFCEHSVVLLQTFFDLAQDSALLFASILDPELHSSIEQFASSLWSATANVPAQITAVEHHYNRFASQFRDLMYMAPTSVPRIPQDLDKVLQRLDAFWKVVSGDLAFMLQDRKVPPIDFSREAKSKWAEYKGCLSGAMDALRQSSDALEVASGSQAANLRSRSGLRAMLTGKDESYHLEPKTLESASHQGRDGQVVPYSKYVSSNRLKRKSGTKTQFTSDTGTEEVKKGFAAFWHRLTQRQAARSRAEPGTSPDYQDPNSPAKNPSLSSSYRKPAPPLSTEQPAQFVSSNSPHNATSSLSKTTASKIAQPAAPSTIAQNAGVERGTPGSLIPGTQARDTKGSKAPTSATSNRGQQFNYQALMNSGLASMVRKNSNPPTTTSSQAMKSEQ